MSLSFAENDEILSNIQTALETMSKEICQIIVPAPSRSDESLYNNILLYNIHYVKQTI